MRDRNLKLFYLHELFFQFSESMMLLVLPIFIYKTFNSISAVFIFSLTWNIIHGLLFLPIFNVAMKWKKPNFFMMAGIFFYMTAQWLFSMVETWNQLMIIPATLSFGLYVSFYWMIRHWFLAVNSDHKDIGRQMSIIWIIKTMIAFVGPILGGAMSFLFSFNTTFFLGILAGGLSMIPIVYLQVSPHLESYSFKKVIHTLKKEQIKAVSPAYFWEGVVAMTANTAWILVFAIFIGNILDLGLLVGFTTLITGLIIWFTGKWFDQKKRAKILTRVTQTRVLTVMLYTSIFFLPSILYVWLVEFINRLVAATHNIVLDAYLYGYGSKIHPVEFSLSRECYLTISRIMVSVLLAVFFLFVPPQGLWLIIFMGSFCILGVLHIKKNDHYLE